VELRGRPSRYTRSQPGTKLETSLFRTNFLITREQYEGLKKLQAKRGNTLSFYVREALNQYLKEAPKTDPKNLCPKP